MGLWKPAAQNCQVPDIESLVSVSLTDAMAGRCALTPVLLI